MALEAGAVFAVLGGRFSEAGFRQFDAALLSSVRSASNAERRISRSHGLMQQSIARVGQAAETTARVGFYALGAAAAVTAYGLGKSIKAAGDFQQQIQVLGAVSGATAKQLEQASRVAIKLGADTSLPATSAKDAADAMVELSKAGFSVQQSIEGARGVLLLATAAQEDTATAAQQVADSINAFGLSAKDATHVVDLFAGANQQSSANMTQVALALQQVGAQAHLMNIPIEETVAAITQLANAGIKGSDAGTSLKTMLQFLTPKSKAAREEMHHLGLEFFDAQGRFKGLEFVVDQLHTKLGKLTKQQQLQALQTIFGTDAIRAAGYLGQLTGRQFDNLTNSVSKAGQAQKLANAQTAGFNGALAAFKSSVETLEISVGTKFLPTLTKGAKALADFISQPAVAAELAHLADTAVADLGRIVGFVRAHWPEIQQIAGQVVQGAEQKFRELEPLIEPVFHALVNVIRTIGPIASAAFDDIVAAARIVAPAVEEVTRVAQSIVDTLGPQTFAGLIVGAAGAAGAIRGLTTAIEIAKGAQKAFLAMTPIGRGLLIGSAVIGGLIGLAQHLDDDRTAADDLRDAIRGASGALLEFKSISGDMASTQADLNAATEEYKAKSAAIEKLQAHGVEWIRKHPQAWRDAIAAQAAAYSRLQGDQTRLEQQQQAAERRFLDFLNGVKGHAGLNELLGRQLGRLGGDQSDLARQNAALQQNQAEVDRILAKQRMGVELTGQEASMLRSYNMALHSRADTERQIVSDQQTLARIASQAYTVQRNLALLRIQEKRGGPLDTRTAKAALDIMRQVDDAQTAAIAKTGKVDGHLADLQAKYRNAVVRFGVEVDSNKALPKLDAVARAAADVGKTKRVVEIIANAKNADDAIHKIIGLFPAVERGAIAKILANIDPARSNLDAIAAQIAALDGRTANTTVTTTHVDVWKNSGPGRHAAGHKTSGPEVALIGEDGPEFVIPVGSKYRQNGMALWLMAGRALGVPGFAHGFPPPPKHGGHRVRETKRDAATHGELEVDDLQKRVDDLQRKLDDAKQKKAKAAEIQKLRRELSAAKKDLHAAQVYESRIQARSETERIAETEMQNAQTRGDRVGFAAARKRALHAVGLEIGQTQETLSRLSNHALSGRRGRELRQRLADLQGQQLALKNASFQAPDLTAKEQKILDRLEERRALAALTPTLADDKSALTAEVHFREDVLSRLRKQHAQPAAITTAAEALLQARTDLANLTQQVTPDTSAILQQAQSRGAALAQANASQAALLEALAGAGSLGSGLGAAFVQINQMLHPSDPAVLAAIARASNRGNDQAGQPRSGRVSVGV